YHIEVGCPYFEGAISPNIFLRPRMASRGPVGGPYTGRLRAAPQLASRGGLISRARTWLDARLFGGLRASGTSWRSGAAGLDRAFSGARKGPVRSRNRGRLGRRRGYSRGGPVGLSPARIRKRGIGGPG